MLRILLVIILVESIEKSFKKSYNKTSVQFSSLPVEVHGEPVPSVGRKIKSTSRNALNSLTGFLIHFNETYYKEIFRKCSGES